MDKLKRFFFTNSSTKQTIIKNTFWLLASEFGMKFLKIWIFIYATRKLGIAEWGLFSYALALMGFFGIASDIGINSVLLRETVAKSDEQNKYIATGFFLKLGLTVLSALALLSLIFFIEDTNTLKVLLPITAILLFVDALREFGFSLNRALEKMEREAFVRLTTTSLLVVLGFIFIKYNPTALSLFYAYIMASILGVFIMYFNLRGYFKNIVKNFNRSLLLPIWREAWPLGITIALGSIMASLDVIILGLFRPPEDVGLYSTAQKLNQVFYLLPTLASTAVLPVFSRFASYNIEKVKNLTDRMVKLSFLFTIPIVLGCFLFGERIFDILFGVEYSSSVLIFKIMSLAILTIAPGSIISNALFAEGKQKRLIKFICISLGLNIILCLLTIPYLGILGASISVTMAYIVGNLILIHNYQKNS